MSTTVDYFYTSISPFSYLGHAKLLQMSENLGFSIRFRPIKLAGVWAESGGVAPPQRHPARLRYRLLELQRWREECGVPLNLQPAHFPTDPSLADRCAITLQEQGENPGIFIERVFQACWMHDKNVADEAAISGLLDDAGFDAHAVLAQSGSDAVSGVYDQNTADGVRFDIIGAPGYVLNGEAFWGQDRLPLLESAIRSGRAPFHAE
ncbi:2-hydroxychromene-2-carboxylate isomerase [Coralliovum pocilloporae]|uniref:2-hydroxychromene-2-carboxylate isomerase n=1 Tax=Coralliovum pocilloporae TaxID=3066369 RepID=UPI00330750A5